MFFMRSWLVKSLRVLEADRPNNHKASAKQDVMCWRARSVWATWAASSAFLRSWCGLGGVVDWRDCHPDNIQRTPPRHHPSPQLLVWASQWRRCSRESVLGHDPALHHWRWGRVLTGHRWAWPGRVGSHAAGSPSVGTWGDSEVIPEWAIVLTCSPCQMLW